MLTLLTLIDESVDKYHILKRDIPLFPSSPKNPHNFQVKDTFTRLRKKNPRSSSESNIVLNFGFDSMMKNRYPRIAVVVLYIQCDMSNHFELNILTRGNPDINDFTTFHIVNF